MQSSAGNGTASLSDAALLERVREHDQEALGELHARHHEAAIRVARAVTSDPHVADDLVSIAFERVHAALLRGHGPEDSFRAYLYTVIRRLAIEQAQRSAREDVVADWTSIEGGFAVAPEDSTEAKLVTKAFGSLPERHQAVLWYLDVEELSPADVAPMLGLTPNAVSALAIRARDALRDAYLQAHVSDRPVDAACAPARRLMGAYVGGRLSRRDTAKLEAHLADCNECPAVLAELREERGRLRAILWPIVIGAAAAAQLGWLGSSQAASAVVALGGAAAGSGGAGAGGAAAGIGGGGSAGLGVGAGAGAVGSGGAGMASGVTAAAAGVKGSLLWVAAAAAAGILVAGGAAVTVALTSSPGSVAAAEPSSGSTDVRAGTPIPGDSRTASPVPSNVPTDSPAGPGPRPSAGPGPVGTQPTDRPTSRPAPSASGTPKADPQPSPDPSPTHAVADPTSEQPAIDVRFDVANDLLLGQVGEIDATVTGVGSVSVGGTLTVRLPSGVTVQTGLVSSLLDLVSGIVRTGGIQSCTQDGDQVVCRVVSLVPGAKGEVRIPVKVGNGAEDRTPSATFTLG